MFNKYLSEFERGIPGSRSSSNLFRAGSAKSLVGDSDTGSPTNFTSPGLGRKPLRPRGSHSSMGSQLGDERELSAQSFLHLAHLINILKGILLAPPNLLVVQDSSRASDKFVLLVKFCWIVAFQFFSRCLF